MYFWIRALPSRRMCAWQRPSAKDASAGSPLDAARARRVTEDLEDVVAAESFELDDEPLADRGL